MKFRPYLVLAMLSMVPCARGDVVVLKNGDRLTGHWTSVVDGKVSFQSDLVGDVTIPLSQIQSFAPAEAVVVLLPEGETASGNMSVVNGEELVVRNSSGTRTLSANSARAIYPEAIYEPNGARRSRKPWRNWRGNGNLGYSLLRGDRHANSASLRFDAIRRQPDLPGLTERWRTNFSAGGLVADTREFSGVHTSANAGSASLRQDFLFTPHNFIFLLGQLEHDEAQSLNLRQTYGTGLGRDLITNSRAAFTGLAGATLVREKFQTQASHTASEGLVGERLNLKITERTSLDHSFNLYPGLSRTGEYRFDGSLFLSTRISSWLSVATGVTDHYLNFPLPGHHNNEAFLTTGLGVNFGK